MTKIFPVTVPLILLALLALSAGCGGGGGGSSATATATVTATAAATPTAASNVSAVVDIKDFDTAHFTTTQTSTSGTDTSSLSGEGLIDNRKQALSVTYEGVTGGEIIAIGRTIYTYSEAQKRWTSGTESGEGSVGFGRPYWPQYWVDAAQAEDLGGQSLQGAETVGYKLSFDRDAVAKRLEPPGSTQLLDIGQAEVEAWVDIKSRYTVRLIFRLEVAIGAQSTRIEITSDFSDFGTEVQIQAPEVATPAPTPGG